MIKDRLFRPSIADDQVLGGKACHESRTRPDLCWILPDRIVHLEIDEHSHVDYEVACELKKNDAANWGFDTREDHRPTVMVRFNPNEYDKRNVSLEERCDALVDVLNRLFINDTAGAGWCDTVTNLIYMFYHSKSDKHIEAARNAKDNMHVLEVH